MFHGTQFKFTKYGSFTYLHKLTFPSLYFYSNLLLISTNYLHEHITPWYFIVMYRSHRVIRQINDRVPFIITVPDEKSLSDILLIKVGHPVTRRPCTTTRPRPSAAKVQLIRPLGHLQKTGKPVPQKTEIPVLQKTEILVLQKMGE